MRTIFVTGATGNQGGAVTRNLIRNGFFVKALVRNPAAFHTEKLTKSENVDVIKGDLSDPSTYHQALEDVDGVFAVFTYNSGIKNEITQGIQLVNAVKKAGVKHLIYSSVIGADLHTGIPHWESKYQIENFIRESGVPFTIIRPSSFYENFNIPQVRSRILKGKLVVPMDKNVVQQIISTEDVGKAVTHMFMHPDRYMSQTITLVSEQLSQEEMAKTFSEALGKEITHQKLPGLITRLFMGKDLHRMFGWINKNGGIFDRNYQVTNAELPSMMTLKEWIQVHFSK